MPKYSSETELCVSSCTLCPKLTQNRNQIVNGTGPEDADILLVGEAPGENEDENGEPFVGRSGDILNKALEKNNLSREKIRITNCVRCRPPNNRDPHKSEIENCNTHLNKEIDAVNPKVIIPLGRVPSETLIGKIDKITNMTGEKYTYQSKSCEAEILISVHPAATIYNRSLKPDFNSVFEKVTDIIK